MEKEGKWQTEKGSSVIPKPVEPGSLCWLIRPRGLKGAGWKKRTWGIITSCSTGEDETLWGWVGHEHGPMSHRKATTKTWCWKGDGILSQGGRGRFVIFLLHGKLLFFLYGWNSRNDCLFSLPEAPPKSFHHLIKQNHASASNVEWGKNKHRT